MNINCLTEGNEQIKSNIFELYFAFEMKQADAEANADATILYIYEYFKSAGVDAVELFRNEIIQKNVLS